MCIEGCIARRFIVQCEQRVVVEGAPLAADATACVPPLPVGGWLPESQQLRMPTGEHIKMWTSINENISQCEHLNKSTWQHLENISTCPWVCLVLLEKILVDRCSFALTWKSQLKNAENIWESLWWMSFFLWVNITPWWTCEDGFTMTYPDTGSVTGGGPFCEHFDQVKLYTIMFISPFDISTGTSGDAGYWWQMWNHMERRVDLCLFVTDCHTMRQCHSSHWRNSGKAVEHLCCGPGSSWIFTKTSRLSRCSLYKSVEARGPWLIDWKNHWGEEWHIISFLWHMPYMYIRHRSH